MYVVTFVHTHTHTQVNQATHCIEKVGHQVDGIYFNDHWSRWFLESDGCKCVFAVYTVTCGHIQVGC